MPPDTPNPAPNPLAFLRRFARARPAETERCGLCDAVIPQEHPHLVEPAARRLVCACRACALLFDHHPAGTFRRVPDLAERFDGFRISDSQWEGLGLPISLAFFLNSSAAGRVVAVYPSPGGATESLLPLEAWEELAAENPLLRELEPDVEALLVNRVDSARDYYRVGIDRCYELVGLIRLHWQGFSGGAAVWDAIDRFFASLDNRGKVQANPRPVSGCV